MITQNKMRRAFTFLLLVMVQSLLGQRWFMHQRKKAIFRCSRSETKAARSLRPLRARTV